MLIVQISPRSLSLSLSLSFSLPSLYAIPQHGIQYPYIIGEYMSGPAQSANLNPIEMAWDEFDRKVAVKQATSAAHLWQLMQENWVEQFSVYLQSFVERMPRIYEAVIAAKGGHFDESKVKDFFCFFV